ncbi:MAG: hypothetical protein ABI769_02020 [Pseudomonadota bacterium]
MAPLSSSEIRRRAQLRRVVVVTCWSGFLAAALATMICFAFIDPRAFAEGRTPEWWTTRSHVYALGFFLFWLTGTAGAGLAWFLARPARRGLRR